MTTFSIKSLWRYPVKSLLGEEVDKLEIDHRGVVNDRIYALFNEQGKIASGKNNERFGRIDGLFSLAGKTTEDGIAIKFPNDVIVPVDSNNINEKLTEALGEPVSLAREAEVSHFDACPIHIITTTSLSRLQSLLPEVSIDERRFRANIVMETPPDTKDDDLIGKTINIGSATLKIIRYTGRCRMVTLEQSELDYNPKILKAISKNFELDFGVYASVVSSGSINVADTIEVSCE